MNPTYTAIATSSGRDARAVTSDGRLDLALAPPKEMGGTGEGTNPEQLFAAGYGEDRIKIDPAVVIRRNMISCFAARPRPAD